MINSPRFLIKMSEIFLQDITKYYGKNLILDNISLDISDREFFVITGPSGCGKTTVLRIIAGLDTDYSGKIFFDGFDFTNLSPCQRNISMVFQDYALYPNLVAKENITFPLKLKKYPQEKISQKLRSTIDLIDIGVERYLDYLPKELSAGHKQRVATGRAIIKESPRVFLMDEPLSNLDAKIRMNTKTYLKKLVTQLKSTTVYVTADSSEAMALADRIGVLNNGKFIQVGSPYDIYYHPENMFVADFFGTLGINFIYGTVKNKKFCFDDYNFDISHYTNNAKLKELYKEPELVLGIRPENISFSVKPMEASIKSKVDLIQRFSPKANIRCKFKNYILNVICFTKDMHEIFRGMDIYLNFDISKILLFYPAMGNLIPPLARFLSHL